jgi:hypothetical protein
VFRGPGQQSRYRKSLWVRLSGDRIPVGTRPSAPVQTDPGAHSASYIMGTGSLPGIKRLGRGVDRPLPCSAEVKERARLFLHSPSRTSWSVLGLILLHVFYDSALFLQLVVWLLCQHNNEEAMNYIYFSRITSNLNTDYVFAKSVRHNLKFRNVPY